MSRTALPPVWLGQSILSCPLTLALRASCWKPTCILREFPTTRFPYRLRLQANISLTGASNHQQCDFIINSSPSFSDLIAFTPKTCHCQLCNIHKIDQFLTFSSTKVLIQTSIVSRSTLAPLYIALPAYSRSPLQTPLSYAVCPLFQLPYCALSPAYLAHLSWIPGPLRFLCHYLRVVIKCIHYLSARFILLIALIDLPLVRPPYGSSSFCSISFLLLFSAGSETL